MIFYVVIDTNVLVSAGLKPTSNPGIILQLVHNGTIVPVINNKILEEYNEVLSRSKFKFNVNQINEIIGNIITKGIYVDEEHIDIKLLDEKDRVFYEVTMKSKEERDTMLVTGNLKHFPIKPFIVSPKELCDIIIKEISELEFSRNV